MAHTWQTINQGDITVGSTINETYISKLRNNVLYLKEQFETDGNQMFGEGEGTHSSSPTDDAVTHLVRDINALEATQRCSSYNSTDYTSVCSSNYSYNSGVLGAQNNAQYSNRTNNGNDGTVNTNDSNDGSDYSYS